MLPQPSCGRLCLIYLPPPGGAHFSFFNLSIPPALCFWVEKGNHSKATPAAAAGLMAAEESGTGHASFLERLVGRSRNRDISLFFPIVLGVMGPPRRDDAQQSSDDRGQERIVLINPFTQGMIVIDGGGANLEALIRGLSEMESGKSGPPPASTASIEAMPAVQVAEEGAECAICLEGMEVGEEAKEMPCKHRYHGECIGKWLGLHGSCPVCRYRMPLEEGEVKKGEGERGAESARDGEIWVSFSLGTRDPTSSNPSNPQAEQHDTLPNNPEG